MTLKSRDIFDEADVLKGLSLKNMAKWGGRAVWRNNNTHTHTTQYVM